MKQTTTVCKLYTNKLLGILFTCKCRKVCVQMWCAKTAAATTNQAFNQSSCTDHHPNCFKENYTLLYFIPARSLVINALVSDAALQTYTEPQWGDCLSACAVSSTSFHSKSIHLQFFSHTSVWKCAALHRSKHSTGN